MAPGQYSVTATSGTCTTSGTYTVNAGTPPATPSVNVVNNCNGTSTLSTTASGTLLWNTAATASPITVSSAGTYTVTQTVNGCVSAAGSGVAAPKTTSTSTTVISAPGSYTWNTTTYSIGGVYTYHTSNAAGCDSAATLNLTITALVPPAEPVVTGILNVCPYMGTSTELTYTASSADASSYVWSLPSNMQLISGAGTGTIVAKFLNGFAAVVNKQLRVKAVNSIGSSSQVIIYLRADAASTPSTIVASSSDVCPIIGTSVPITYTVPKAAAALSYIWAFQSNTTSIVHPNGAGENDTTVTVTFSSAFTSSSITVQSVNSCGASAIRSLVVSKNTPSTPSLISGPANSCEYIGDAGAIATYSVGANATVASYDWIIPASATNITGQGTSSISFKYPAGFTTGTVSVTATNGCGTSGARSLNITRQTPGMPSTIDVINVGACPGRSYSYTIASMPCNTTSLLWTVPADAISFTGQGSTSVTVIYPSTAINGVVTVKSVSNCGMSALKTSTVKLGACAAPAPYTKGAVIAEPSTMTVIVYPNPTTSNFNMQVITADKEAVSVRILDVQGRMVKEIKVAPYQTINFGAELKAGSYFIEVRQGKVVKTERVVKF